MTQLSNHNRDTPIGLLVLAVFVAFLFGTVLGSCTPRTLSQQPVGDLPFPFPRPKPRPPEPPPAPLEDSDSKLFSRLRGHISQLAEERATAKLEAAFVEAADNINRTNITESGELVMMDNGDDKVQFLASALLAGAITALVKKIIMALVMAVVGAAIIALLVKFWVWIAGGFVLCVTIVAWPIAFAAAKLAAPKESK